MYQVKITKEGLVNAFKVLREILHKYDAETGEEIPRYQRTFNVIQVEEMKDSQNLWRTTLEPAV